MAKEKWNESLLKKKDNDHYHHITRQRQREIQLSKCVDDFDHATHSTQQ